MYVRRSGWEWERECFAVDVHNTYATTHTHKNQVGLVAFFVFAIRAILRENVALLGVHLLVCILLVGGAIWWLVKERSMPDTDGTKMGVVSALLPVTVLIVVCNGGVVFVWG